MNTYAQIHQLQKQILHEHNKTHRNFYRLQLSLLQTLAEAEKAEKEQQEQEENENIC